MAIAFVNATSGSDITGSSVSSVSATSISHTAGNLLYVFVRTGGIGGAGFDPGISITNTANDSWTQIGSTNVVGPPPGPVAQFYTRATKGNANDVVTVHLANADNFVGLTVLQFSGADPFTPQDTSATGTGSGTSVTSASFTTHRPGEVIVMGATLDSISGAFTAGAIGGTTATIPTGATTNSMNTAEYLIVSTERAGITAAMNYDSSHSWAALVATFREPFFLVTNVVRP